MKKQALSAVVLVLGGILIFGISGYGGAGHDHSHDHPAESPKASDATNSKTDFLLTDALKAELDLEVGTAETPDIPGSEDLWIAVPTEALTSLSADGKKASVYFSETSPKDGVPQKFTATEVELGDIRAGFVEVKSGLFPGDTVIVKNASRIGERGGIGKAEKQATPPVTKSPDVDTTTPPDAPEPKTVKADRTQPSELAKGSKDMPGTKNRVACDFRCPVEDEVTPSVCPDGPACDKERSFRGWECDRKVYRGSRSRRYRGTCELQR